MDAQDELIDLEDRVDRAHVVRRVQDWARRIDSLYTDILRWLPAGWTGSTNGTVRFDEELMRKFGVTAEQLPTLHLQSGERRARVEPRGLWIIGANGRVDLVTPDRHFLIVDRAEAFEPPHWRVASLEHRLQDQPLNIAVLSEMLG